jgi:hypothetical protein
MDTEIDAARSLREAAQAVHVSVTDGLGRLFDAVDPWTTSSRLIGTEDVLIAAIRHRQRDSFDDPIFWRVFSELVGERFNSNQLNALLNGKFEVSEKRTSSTPGLSEGIISTLQRASQWPDRLDGSAVGVKAFLLAVFDDKERGACQALRSVDINPFDLAREIERRLNAAGNKQDPTSAATPRKLDFSRYVTRYGNDDPRRASDLIDIRDEVDAFARLAASRNAAPPLSIGVFGNWGSGKSFFMEQMHKTVDRLALSARNDAKAVPPKPSQFYGEIVQIRFNAWHYIESNLWASLVEYIFNELDGWLRRTGDHDRVNSFFDQLATSRQLKLEAYRDLVRNRLESKAAQEELVTAQTAYSEALKQATTKPVANRWSLLAETFVGGMGTAEKAKLTQAANDLGLAKIEQSSADLTKLVEDTRTQVTRAQVLANSLTTRFGSPLATTCAAAAVLASPFLFGLLVVCLQAAFKWQWLQYLQGGIASVTASVATIIALAGAALSRGRKALDTLDEFRVKLDQAAKAQASVEADRLAAAQSFAEEKRKAAAEAEAKATAAKERELAAQRAYDNDSASGRLNRFIRSKVEEAIYAKHLGIIASIRRDFGQLADLMQPPDNDQGLTNEVEKNWRQHLQKVDALIAAAADTLLDAERTALRTRPERVAQKAFERIVLYIDDLDRCPPDKVVDVLQAIHMLLSFPLFVVVVAVDTRWMAHSLHTQFPKMIGDRQALRAGLQPDKDDDGPQPADAQDYLEKIFQIPYWVRRMDEVTSINFTHRLAATFQAKPSGTGLPLPTPPSPLDDPPPIPPGRPGTDTRPRTLRPTPGEPIETREMNLTPEESDLLSDFAPFLGGSPRRAKRYVNLYILVKTTLQQTESWQSDPLAGQRAAVALLAITTGMEKVAEFFAALDDKKITDLKVLDDALSSNGLGPSAVIAKLTELVGEGPGAGGAVVAAMRTFAPTVRRYSF